MSLTKYEDFLHLGVNALTNFLAVRGLSTGGRKIEMVARAYAAVEMKIPIQSTPICFENMTSKTLTQFLLKKASMTSQNGQKSTLVLSLPIF